MQTCGLCLFFNLASVSLCDSGLSFRCAHTEKLHISPIRGRLGRLRAGHSAAQLVEARLPLAERELFGSLRVQLALSRMIRSEHCTGEG